MINGKEHFILAAKLKKLSLEKGFSIKALSEKSQVPLKTIYGWLAGSHPRSLIDVKKVSQCLGVSMDELAFSSEVSPKAPEDVIATSQRLISEILSLIVRHPESVSVAVLSNERTTVFEVDIHEEDFGPLLGAKGKHIDGLRALIGAITAKQGIRSVINVKDEERFF